MKYLKHWHMLAITAVLSLTLLTGCGGDEGSSSSPNQDSFPPASSMPENSPDDTVGDNATDDDSQKPDPERPDTWKIENGTLIAPRDLSSLYFIQSEVAQIVSENNINCIDFSNTNLTFISAQFFSNFNIQSVKLPASLTEIQSAAFSNCTSLTGIDMSNCVNLKVIGAGAFQFCKNLSSVTLPANVKTIEDAAFCDCENLASINLGECSKLESIGMAAFARCSNLTHVTLPDSLNSIGQEAFSMCSSLTSIDLPDGITSISKLTFSQCTKLTSVNLPDDLITIGDNAFDHCYNLIDIILPTSVTTIGESAFCDCRQLPNINLPASVTDIGKYAFLRCNSLSSIVLPTNLTKIGYGAFSGCGRLANLDMSACISLSFIDEQAFYQSGLSKIILPNSLSNKCLTIMSNSFGTNLGLSGYLSICIPDSSVTARNFNFQTDSFNNRAVVLYYDGLNGTAIAEKFKTAGAKGTESSVTIEIKSTSDFPGSSFSTDPSSFGLFL